MARTMGSALGCRGEADSSVVIVLCQGPFRLDPRRIPTPQFFAKSRSRNPRTCGLVFSDFPPAHWLYRKMTSRFVKIVPVKWIKPAQAGPADARFRTVGYASAAQTAYLSAIGTVFNTMLRPATIKTGRFNVVRLDSALGGRPWLVHGAIDQIVGGETPAGRHRSEAVQNRPKA